VRISWILPEAEYAGGTRVIAIHAQQLEARGHDVVVISTPRKLPTWRQQLRTLLKERRWLSRAVRRPSHFDDVDIDHRILDRVRDVTDEDVPDGDVVIATWWETAGAVDRLSPSKGAKAYFMQDYGAPGMEIEDLVPTWQWPLHKITISQYLVDLIREHVGPVPVELVPNSVDTEVFSASNRGKARTPTVGFLFRTEPVKGADIVFEAVEIARRELPTLRLVAYGARAEPGGTKPPADMDYHIFPTDEELRDLYATCDAWLFSSRREGFGLPVLEAMACGTPVIATPAGAAPELVAEHGGGVIVDHESPQAMAREIVRFCTLDEAAWQKYSQAALTTARSYSWNDAGDRFEASLHAAIEAAQRKTREPAS